MRKTCRGTWCMLRVCCMLHAVLGVVLHAVLHVACCVACSAEATVAGFPHAANTHPCNMQHSMQHTTIEHATCNILQCKGAGASANCCNRDGFSPLHVAAAHTVGLPALRCSPFCSTVTVNVPCASRSVYVWAGSAHPRGFVLCALAIVIGYRRHGSALRCRVRWSNFSSHTTPTPTRSTAMA